MSPILVVEDDALTSDLLRDALESQGYQVLLAPHGLAALQLLEQYRPCAIVLDIRMPVMDGPTFAEQYAMLPGPHAPIIVVSGEDEARHACSGIPLAGFLDKPFQLDVLYRLVARVCPPSAPAKGASASWHDMPDLSWAGHAEHWRQEEERTWHD